MAEIDQAGGGADELIRTDAERSAQQRLESLLLEGLRSEESELTPEDFEAIRGEASRRLKGCNDSLDSLDL